MSIEAKKAVLQEIIDMMDERMNSKLRSKSPKFQAKEPEAISEEESSEDPAEALKQKLMGTEDAEEESPKHEITMPGEDSPEDDSDEDKQRLLELYSKLK